MKSNEKESMERSYVGGPKRLGQFLASPPEVQASFMAAVATQACAQQDFDRWLAEVESDDPTPPRQPETRLPHRPVRWSKSWQARGRGARSAARSHGRDFDAERRRFEEMVPCDYVSALIGESVQPYRRIHCPLPDHEDLRPDFRVTDERWQCFGCGRSGRIYDLAGHLWDLQPRGPSFREIHERLVELIG